MPKAHLIIVSGIPGAGKSTFALRAADRWGAASFASETFANDLGANARAASGDLSKQAISHAYSAMGAGVSGALASNKLVVAVGSFRSEEQRVRFREIARRAGANATTIRITCSLATAAQRIHARRAAGEPGPSADAIHQIAAALDLAHDIDLVLTNDASVEAFHRRIDAVLDNL